MAKVVLSQPVGRPTNCSCPIPIFGDRATTLAKAIKTIYIDIYLDIMQMVLIAFFICRQTAIMINFGVNK